MTEDEKELFIITEKDLELIKKRALEILEILPDEPKTALLIVSFLKYHIEDETGLKVEGIKVR